MNTGTIYVWSKGQVASLNKEVNIPQQISKLGLFDCYICDTRYSTEKSRYGSYTKSESFLSGMYWQSAYYKDIPPEFKTHLLLLGVPQ